MKPLEGIKVLDLTQFRSGPVCTNILLDLGADVVKFENAALGGDSNRYGVHEGPSAEFMSTCRGKKSVLADFRNQEIRKLFLKLVEEADVVVENYRPGTMQKFGLDYETLKRVNEKIVMTSISGYGQTGPMANMGAYDMSIQAISGFMSLTGEPGGEWMKAGVSLADMMGALWGAISTISALYNREKTGVGTYIDVAMLDTMLFLQDAQAADYFATGRAPERMGNRHMFATPFQPYPCQNGEYVFVCCPQIHQFESFCEGLGHPEIAQNERFQSQAARYRNRQELDEILSAITREWSANDLREMMKSRNLAYGEMYTLPQALDMEQIREREMVADVHWKNNENTYHVLASPVHMRNMERKTEYQMAELGEHTYDVFGKYAKKEDLQNIFQPYFEALPEIAKKR